MALTVIKPTGIDTSGNYTVNGMNVSANASVANLTVTTSLNLLTTSANLGPVGNVIITGGTSGYVLQTDGAGNLSWQAPASGSSISNGNSNVSIPTANGNINFTAVGNTVMVITGTGANIAGTANVSGNLTAGNANLGNLVTANLFTGTLTTNAQPNITSVGNLSSLTVDNGTYGNVVITQFGSVYASGTGSNPYSIMQVTSNDTTTGMGMRAYTGLNGQIYSNSGITFTTGATIRDKDYPTGGTSRATLDSNGLAVTGNITAGNANLGNSVTANYFTGTLTTAAQPNITSVGTLTDLSVSGNGVFGGNLTVNGTLTYINSTTLSISDPIINLQTGPNGAAPVANTGKDVGTALNYYDTSAKIAWMGWDVSNAEIAFGSNVGIASEVVTFTELANIRSGNAQLGNTVSANFFTGTLTTAAQPNITSVGSLTGLTVSNATGVVNFTTTANVTLGAVANLHIAGGTSNQYLQTDGTGNLSWSTVITGSASNISNGNSNVNIPAANGNINFSAVGNTIMVVTGTGVNVAGTLNTGAGIITGNGSGLSSLAGANVSGEVTYAATANSVAGSNVSGQVGNSLVSGTVYTNTQPNITAVGSLTGLNVSNATGVVDFTTTANVTLGAVGNLHISGGTANYVLKTDGAGNLDWVAQSGGNAANVTVDNFTGNGVQTIFTLSTTPIGINQTSVNYNGATVLRTDYTLANANITFSSAPANGSYIEVTTINLTSGGGGSSLTIQDEGSNLTTTASLINFVGNGIAATNVGNSVTVTVNTSGATSARALGYSLIFGG